MTRWADHPFWQAPHRPLFLFAGLWAVATPSVWLLPGGSGRDPVLWHLHELMFGMGGAAVGGYLLTALPAWTGRKVSSRTTLVFTTLWLLSRLGFAAGGSLPIGLQLVAILAYFLFLAAFLAWALLLAGLWSRAWLLAPVIGLTAADSALLVDPDGLRTGGTALVPVLIFAFLISGIGGRAVPAFTRHWLERSKIPARLQDSQSLSAAAIATLAAGACLAFWQMDIAAGICLIASAVLQFVRMTRWQFMTTIRYPALFVLHLAWAWLPAGLLLVGLALLWPDIIGVATALHGLTMGAMGTMMLAIMGRAAMLRQGETLVLSPTLAFGLALVWLSAPVRIAAGLLPVDGFDSVPIAALFWMAGWALFLKAHLASLRRPIPRPVLSARTLT